MEITKTKLDFDHKQINERVIYLHRMRELSNNGPLSVKEKDWFNLQYARTNIMYGSISYRSGLIKTLRNSITRLEKDMTKEELKRVGAIKVNSQ